MSLSYKYGRTEITSAKLYDAKTNEFVQDIPIIDLRRDSDCSICPNCDSDDTECTYDDVYDSGLSTHYCEACTAKYKVQWSKKVISKELGK